MSTQTTDKTAKATRKRGPSKAPTDFLGQKRVEMAAKAKELSAEMKEIQKRLDKAEKARETAFNERNALAADLFAKTDERDRVVAGLAAIDKGLAALKTS